MRYFRLLNNILEVIIADFRNIFLSDLRIVVCVDNSENRIQIACGNDVKEVSVYDGLDVKRTLLIKHLFEFSRDEVAESVEEVREVSSVGNSDDFIFVDMIVDVTENDFYGSL